MNWLYIHYRHDVVITDEFSPPFSDDTKEEIRERGWINETIDVTKAIKELRAHKRDLY